MAEWGRMDTTMTNNQPRIADVAIEGMRQFMRRNAEAWSDMTQQLLDEQRIHMLEKEPTQKDLDAQRQRLTWMFRFMRPLYAAVSDPDYPDPWPAQELKGRLIQLEHSWRIFQEPQMTEAEADEILKKVFPE